MNAMTEPRRTAIEAGLVGRVAAGVRYIVSGVAPTDWFGPMQPMPPVAPPAIAGRSFDFPVGANLRIQPRPDETIGFADLRGLADGYDLLRLVIETRKDQIAKLDWTIRPRDSKKSGAEDPRLKAVGDFLSYPDREHDFETWLRLLLEDLLVIDAPTLYVRRDGAGALYALEVVDGATIKRVIDERGRTPQPPDVAYQQVLKGMPAIDYSTDELLYRPRNPRPHKIYGYSPVEQVVMTVNVALRRQVAQLQYYTEGNVPEAMIGVPETWSPDQIRQFQEYWDSLLEGNTAARRHAKFVPAGMKPTFTREPMLKDEYDEWLARVICFAFSIAPTPFVRDNNRATAQTTRAAALTEGLTPLLRWVKRLLDEAIGRHLGYADLEFVWSDEKDDNPADQARINDTYVRAGIKSVDEVRTELGLAPVGFGNAIYTGQGAVPLRDVGKAQEPAAKRAGEETLAKYSDDEPRVPSGQTGAGEWTSGGANDGGGESSRERVADVSTDKKERSLTEGEKALARTIFGDRLDYDNIVIHHERRFEGQPSDVTISPGRSSILSSERPIYFPEDSPNYHDDFSQGTTTQERGHLVHELTHVLQDQEGISVGIIAHAIGNDYHYDLLDADGNPKSLSSFGLEQQAEIVQDYFLLKHGSSTNFSDQKAFPISLYERVLDVGPDGTIRASIKRPEIPASDRGR
jgi:PAS domain-containing protein